MKRLSYMLINMKLQLLYLLNFVSYAYCLTGNNVYNFVQKNLLEHVTENIHEDPEVKMNATQLIVSKGYPCENYDIHTVDGFILGIQRIPHGKNEKINTKNEKRPVAFLQHGLLCSSTNWLTNLENESLAFLLADAGFDVWLGNIRGNTYSRRHEKYSPDDEEFWAWSWDQMSMYDVPAMIDFTLNKTGTGSLYYIGHSQGTLIMFTHLAQNPEFGHKIKSFYALGPVATVGHIESPLKFLAHYTREIQDLFRDLGVKDFLPNSDIFKILGSTVCRFLYTRDICEDVMFLICGYDTHNMNQTRLPVYIGHTPAGTSVRNMVHFAQMIRSGKLQMYNYGSAAKNEQHYGTEVPPLYYLSNVTVPVALFSASEDWLADPQDVSYLRHNLPNVIYNQEIPNWDHLDFIWAIDAPQTIYQKIIKMMISDFSNS